MNHPVRPAKLAALAFALLAAAGLPAAARAAEKEGLDKPINLDIVKGPNVFKILADVVGMEPVVDPALKDRLLTLRLESVRARTALDAACDSLGCRWQVEPGNPPRLRVTALAAKPPGVVDPKAGLTQPIDLKVTQAQVPELLHTFGQILSAEVQVGPGLGGKVDFELTNVPVGEALDTVCKKVGCTWKLTGGDKPVLVFAAKGK